MSRSVAVIGSGLAALSACKALISKGIKPVVLDVGMELPQQQKEISQEFSHLAPDEWPLSDRLFLNHNPTVLGKQHPRKLMFGSDYFYGKPCDAGIKSDLEEASPPFSFAKGGFSVGWGASVLFPDDIDLVDWPVSTKTLAQHFKAVISDLPYSAKDDSLSINFPLMKLPDQSIKLTNGNSRFLKTLSESGLLKKDELVFGQARLLVNAKSCLYCGGCLSGCVYDAIYKANTEFDFLISTNAIDYKAGVHVDQLEDLSDSTIVHYRNTDGRHHQLQFDRTLLAAGAVNSTAILMKSKRLYEKTAVIKTTVGFIAPVLKLKGVKLDWPKDNTMPGVFLEYKAKKLSNHWIHTQLSTPNELVLYKSGISFVKAGLKEKIKRKLMSHLMIAHGNIHSTHANHYELTMKLNDKNTTVFHSKRQHSASAKHAVEEAVKAFSKFSPKFGCYVLKPLLKDSTKAQGYHLGGSFPMRNKPTSDFHTDTIGRPLGWKNIHVVDSSIFPSLPATTIGVLSMANARRIVSEMDL